MRLATLVPLVGLHGTTIVSPYRAVMVCKLLTKEQNRQKKHFNNSRGTQNGELVVVSGNH